MNQTHLEDWLEWKDKCAIRLCSPDVQSRFEIFALSRMPGLAKESVSNALGSVSGRDCWHEFECHTHAASRTTGKRWKDWLFERASMSASRGRDPVSALQANATNMFKRDVGRAFAGNEGSVRIMGGGKETTVVSLEEPRGQNDSGDSLRLEYLISSSPDENNPYNVAALREIEVMAEEQAQKFFADLPFRDRVILWTIGEKVSLDHPEVARLTETRKSVLYERRKAILERLRSQIRETFPDDDLEDVQYLYVRTRLILFSLVNEWIQSENRCRVLFSLGKTT